MKRAPIKLTVFSGIVSRTPKFESVNCTVHLLKDVVSKIVPNARISHSTCSSPFSSNRMFALYGAEGAVKLGGG